MMTASDHGSSLIGCADVGINDSAHALISEFRFRKYDPVRDEFFDAPYPLRFPALHREAIAEGSVSLCDEGARVLARGEG